MVDQMELEVENHSNPFLENGARWVLTTTFPASIGKRYELCSDYTRDEISKEFLDLLKKKLPKLTEEEEVDGC